MPKLKTHKGLKKVLNVRKSGTVTTGHPGSRHNTGKKSAKFNRRKRMVAGLSKADNNRFKNIVR